MIILTRIYYPKSVFGNRLPGLMLAYVIFDDKVRLETEAERMKSRVNILRNDTYIKCLGLN